MIQQILTAPRNGAGTRLRHRVSLEVAPNSWGDDLAVRCHYLHRAVRARRLTYAVLLDGETVGFIQISDLPAPVLPRPLREAGLKPDQVVHLARMWVRDDTPKCVESCALGHLRRCVRDDWQSIAGVRPRAILTYHDAVAGQTGTVYRAAGFTPVGPTRNAYRGRSRRGLRYAPASLRQGRFAWVWVFGEEQER